VEDAVPDCVFSVFGKNVAPLHIVSATDRVNTTSNSFEQYMMVKKEYNSKIIQVGY
jgi:hypothetical protein